jgi:antitoxin component YwqK of YwqJK toxin-antitoxin module
MGSYFSGLKEHKEYYKNGQIKMHEFHLNGQLEGERKVWNEDGQLRLLEFYRDKELEELKIWDRQILKLLKWSKTGYVESYFWNGRLYRREICQNNVIKIDQYHQNGRLSDRKIYRNEGLEEEHKTWYENGNPEQYSFFRRKQREGEQRCWYSWGQLKHRSFYRDGMLMGYHFSRVSDFNNFNFSTKMIFIALKRKTLFRHKCGSNSSMLNTFLIDDLKNIILKDYL